MGENANLIKSGGQDSAPHQQPLSLRQELRRENWGLQHHAPEDFLRSQWQSGLTSRWFLGYRWLLGIFFGTGVISCLAKYHHNGRWFIYLTDWGFLLCGMTSVSGAIFVTIHHWNPQRMVRYSTQIKAYWMCYWINLIFANVIALVYWTCIYPLDRDPTNPAYCTVLYNIWTHAMPSLLFTVDHLIVAQPSRLLHFVYPLAFGWVYTGFTLIYYAMGGLDVKGHRYIYHVLNYSKPRQAMLTIALISASTVVVSTLQYGVYRLRTLLARKLGKLQ